MTLLLKILRYNDILTPMVALVGNVILLYLIVTVNKLSMKKISFVLMPSCLMDMVLSLVTFAMAPQVFNIKLNAYVVVGSPLSHFGFQGASILMWTYATVVITSMNAVCIPFYLRYQVICKNTPLSGKHLIKPYCILLLTFILLFAGFAWCFQPIAENNMHFRLPTFNEFWLDEYENGPVFVAAAVDSWSFIIPYSFIIFTAVISYSMVLYYSIKITRTLKSHVTNYAGTKILSKQLHKTLIIQAIGPLLVANVPILSLIAMIFLKIENLHVSLFFSFFLGWIPIVNPLAAMVIITPYRNRVKNLLGLKESATVTVSSIISHP